MMVRRVFAATNKYSKNIIILKFRMTLHREMITDAMYDAARAFLIPDPEYYLAGGTALALHQAPYKSLLLREKTANRGNENREHSTFVFSLAVYRVDRACGADVAVLC